MKTCGVRKSNFPIYLTAWQSHRLRSRPSDSVGCAVSLAIAKTIIANAGFSDGSAGLKPRARVVVRARAGVADPARQPKS